MPISSLVLTLSANPKQRQQALERINNHPALLAGEMHDRWIGIAAEAEDDRACRSLHDWLMTVPGVLFVNVVAVDFELDALESGGHALHASIESPRERSL